MILKIVHQVRQFWRSLLKGVFPIALFMLTGLLVISLSPANAITIGYLSEQGELFRQVLAAAKLTPEDVKVDMQDLGLWGGDKYRVKLLDVFFDNPWKISPYTRTMSDGLLADKSDLAQLTASAYRRIEGGVSPQLNGDLLTKYKQQVQKLGDDALAVALGKLTNQAADSLKTSEYKALSPQLRSAVAQFLLTIPDVLHYRQVGLLRSLAKLQLDVDNTYNEVFNFAVKTVEEEAAETEEDIRPEQVLFIESLLDNVDFKLLNTGAILAAAAVQEMQRQLSQIPVDVLQGNYHYSLDTPQGKIILSGEGDRIYPTDDYLLIVDTAGNDSYAGGAANRDINHGISVILDLAGKDKYISPPGKVPSFGAGIFGYATLIDVQGDDIYEAQYASQGIGIFGTGILYDVQGEDTYQGISHLQGSGTFGSGLLIDNAGSDRYSLYRYGQGYGFTKGIGLLLDSVGDDKYIGLEDKYANGGPFGEKRHIHFIQGAGFGRRGDYTEGHSWAGGVGMLIDGAGNDSYECEVYGQGSAYWYSLGFLVDKAGDDYHDAGWYSLGSSPHFGVGIYQDDGGSDRYTGIIMQSLGNGRDWSIGWFEDSAGNDWYNGSLMTFGTGDVNGIGVFWDKQGDDTYLSFLEPAYGQSRLQGSTGLREVMLTLGLFVDGGGKDKYLLLADKDPQNRLPDSAIDIQSLANNPVAGNDRTWCRATSPKYVKMAYGCGIDAHSVNSQ